MADDVILREQIFGAWAMPMLAHPLYSLIPPTYYGEVWRRYVAINRTIGSRAQVSRRFEDNVEVTRIISDRYEELEKL